MILFVGNFSPLHLFLTLLSSELPVANLRIIKKKNPNNTDPKQIPELKIFCCWDSNHGFLVLRSLPAHFQGNKGLKHMDSEGSPPPAAEKTEVIDLTPLPGGSR